MLLLLYRFKMNATFQKRDGSKFLTCDFKFANCVEVAIVANEKIVTKNDVCFREVWDASVNL